MDYRVNGNMLDEEFKGNVLILETVKKLWKFGHAIVFKIMAKEINFLHLNQVTISL